MIRKSLESSVEYFVFACRWLQAPIYLGLIIGSGFYCYKFLLQLVTMFQTLSTTNEEEVMLEVLGLVDMSMVANLIYMVIVGGYTMFVSKIDIDQHPDRPEWLQSTNANTLKIKLASSLIGVSSIHLLKTFIELGRTGHNQAILLSHVKWQVLIHITFLGSSLALAVSERILHPAHPSGSHHH